MSRIFNYVILIVIVAGAAMSAAAQDEKYNWEFFGGFTYASYDNVLNAIDNRIDPNIGLRGVNASITGNVSRYVGIKFDYALLGNRREINEPGTVLQIKYKNNEFMGGVQFKDNAKDGPRWKPFGHVLAGLSNQKLNVAGTFDDGMGRIHLLDESPSSNNFTMLIGAGLDVRVHKNVDIRLIQVDYNPVFFGDQTIETLAIPGKTQNNVRLSFGVAFH